MASTPYTVQAGDWLQKIAEAHGFASWRDLYYHEDNAAFRAKRPNPDKIYPGDVVMIPGATAPPEKKKPKPKPGTGEELETVIAEKGDTLCSIAVEHGFADCGPLRPVNPDFDDRPVEEGDEVKIPERTEGQEEGETEQVHTFERLGVPITSVRFVHGSQSLPFEADLTLTTLNISNYITDRAGGPDGNANFVDDNARQFDSDADQDADAFKIELTDPRTTQNTLAVDLQALKPVYDPNDAAGRRVLRHEEFTGAELARRSLNSIVVDRQGTSDRFRSCYLRLVTDDADKNNPSTVGALPAGTFPPQAGHAGRPKQTLLVSDMHDQNDTQVEILDQVALGSHTITTCPGTGGGQCRARTEAPVGTDRRRMRVALHVLRQTRGGTPVVPLADAERRLRTWFRRVYAQAGIGPLIVTSREVDPVENLIAVSEAPTGAGANAGGALAAGVDGSNNPSQLGFRIDGFDASGNALPTQVVGPIRPTSGQSPLITAQRLAALVQAPYVAASPTRLNARRFVDTRGSADILITVAAGGHVTIPQAQIVSTDTAQTLTVARANPLPALLQDWGDRFQTGSLHQRVIMRNHGTGNNRVDIFVVAAFTSGDRGEALMKGNRFNDPTLRALPEIEFSVFVVQSTMGAGDGDPYVLGHEVGHVAGEVVHAPAVINAAGVITGGDRFQLMCSAVTGNEDVGGSKRVRDGVVTYDSPAQAIDLVARLRTQGANLLESW